MTCCFCIFWICAVCLVYDVWQNYYEILPPTAEQYQGNQIEEQGYYILQNKTKKLAVMGTVNVLTQMAEYDFNAPINVEMIFEDSDDDDASFQNEHGEQENIKDNNNNKQVAVEKNETEKKNTNSENQINREGLNKSMLSLKPIEAIIEDIADNNLDNSQNTEIIENTNVVHNHNQNIPDGNQQATILISDDTVHNAEIVPVSRRLTDHHDPVTTFIEDLLNKLSEHIVLIMQAFHHYGAKKTNEETQKKEAIFHFIKSHFFELSYTTAESILLPQERNETFINQFLDNTVLLANRKSLKWRCQRRTVIPFFNELITWTKQKREHIKNNNRPCPSNENVMLKQQLVRPLAPLNLLQTEIVANYTNTETPQAQNNRCIFSSGTPGNEISINIDANTFIQFTENQTCETLAQNVNHNNNAPNCEPTRGKTTAARPRYGNRGKDIQKTIPKYHRRPPPVNLCHNHKNITTRPQQYFQTNANNYNQINVNRTYNNNMGQPHQNYQQPNPSYPTQMQFMNTNQTTPAHNDHLNNLLFDNSTNRNIPMHGTPMETSSPVITSVSSLNPNTIRCCMCGKSTSRPCEPYMYSPCTPIYCSYLCQELDSQFYKRTWVNT